MNKCQTLIEIRTEKQLYSIVDLVPDTGIHISISTQQETELDQIDDFGSNTRSDNWCFVKRKCQINYGF